MVTGTSFHHAWWHCLLW